VVQGADDVRWHAEAEVAHDLKSVLPKMRVQPYVSEVRGMWRGVAGAFMCVLWGEVGHLVKAEVSMWRLSEFAAACSGRG
jgi:hypothetical protein